MGGDNPLLYSHKMIDIEQDKDKDSCGLNNKNTIQDNTQKCKSVSDLKKCISNISKSNKVNMSR